MADFTSDAPKAHTTRRRDTEFHVYFALIFVLAVPFAIVGWVSEIVRRRTLNLRGPLARAWLEADRITPLLFQG